MRNFAIFVGFAAICIALRHFLLAPLFLTERVEGATSLQIATLFTIAIAAAVVRK